jgi:hypothetical protein
VPTAPATRTALAIRANPANSANAANVANSVNSTIIGGRPDASEVP